MGASTSKVLGQFMVEGVLLSVVAAVIAIVLSIFVLAPIASLILPVPVQQGVTVMLDANGTMYLGASNVGPRPILPGESPPSIIATSLSVEWLALCFGVAVLLGALGSLYPALKAARTKPAEAMRYE
jgi:ABC-type lipoprotein release transport system permease subunit